MQKQLIVWRQQGWRVRLWIEFHTLFSCFPGVQGPFYCILE